MQEFVDNKHYNYTSQFPAYKSAMTTFDNTARKIYTGAYMFALSPALYKQWLSDLIKTTDQDYVFISAWNEWAEGNHLEPDRQYGHRYLEATRNALGEQGC